jgi:hypothetical protein
MSILPPSDQFSDQFIHARIIQWVATGQRRAIDFRFLSLTFLAGTDHPYRTGKIGAQNAPDARCCDFPFSPDSLCGDGIEFWTEQLINHRGEPR